MRLFFLMFTILLTTLAGTGVIAALTAGFDTLTPILIAAGAGALIALPVSWIVAKKIAALG